MELKNMPTEEQVRLIFKETYNLYIKYKNCSKDEEFKSLLDVVHELSIKYPFELCENILCNLMNIISKSGTQ